MLKIHLYMNGDYSRDSASLTAVLSALLLTLFAARGSMTAAEDAGALADSRRTVAIIEWQSEQEVAPRVLAELQSVLLECGSVALVEREDIDRVLREREYVVSGIAARNMCSELANIVPADTYLFVHSIPGMDFPATRLDLTESRTGVLLGSWLRSNEALATDPKRLLSQVQDALARQSLPMDQRHIVSVLGFRNETIDTGLDGIASAMEELLTDDLARQPSVLLLDRHHLYQLAEEEAVSGIETELRSAVVMLSGGVRPAPDSERLEVSLVVTSVNGSINRTETLNIPGSDPLASRPEVAAAALDLLDFPGTVKQSGASSCSQEAALYAKQAFLWQRWGDSDRARQPAETAYALDPTESNRLALARMLAAGSSPAIRHSLRANRLILQYCGNRASAPVAKTNRRQDLILPTLGYSPQLLDEELRREEPKMAEQLVREENRVFRALLKHYSSIYPTVGKAYWNTWSARLSSIATYAPDDRVGQQELLYEALDAFFSPPSSPHWFPVERLRMLNSIRHFFDKDDDLSQALLEELVSHNDPFVRYVGLSIRMHLLGFERRAEHPTFCPGEADSRRALFRILTEELTPAHPYRSEKQERSTPPHVSDFFLYGLLPYDGGSHIVPRDVVEADVLDGARLIESVLEYGDPLRLGALEAARKFDCLAALERNGHKAEAIRLTRRILEASQGHQERYLWRYRDKLALLARLEGRDIDDVAGSLCSDGAPPLPVNDTAWKQYDILPLRLVPHPLGGREHDPLGSSVACVEENRLYCVHALSSGRSSTETAFRLDVFEIPSGRHLRRTEYFPAVKWPQGAYWQPQHVFSVAAHMDHVYIGTSSGLLVVALASNTWMSLTHADGLPGRVVRSLTWYGDRLYMGLGRHPYDREDRLPAAFAAYEPQSAAFTVLASEKSVIPGSPLDGSPFALRRIVADPANDCLWLDDERSGIYRYDPISQKIEEVVSGADNLELSICGPGAWPTLWRPKDRTAVKVPRIVSGRYVRPHAVAWDGESAIISATSWFSPQEKARVVDPQDRRQVLLLLQEEKAAGLWRLPDGSPLPPIQHLLRTDAGVLLLCNDGRAFLLRRHVGRAKAVTP
ncbi:MAG: hypothetical protein HQ523_16335 [Lentisphaerae bacterium]|nr:hypothetical protein [Lentisphaerota bacterium]